MQSFGKAEKTAMKKYGKLVWRILFFLCLLFPWAARSEAGRQITVMVYMCGSNLESQYGSATADLREMAEAGLDSGSASVLVYTGGSSLWYDGSTPEETVITEIGSRGQRVLERFGSRNMGQRETLSSFLEYAVKARPAERYALILWDHGGGPMEGICWDELFGSDHLSMQELTEALDASPFAARKLDWIGFDACLMSSVEVAGKLAPYADYMIASQAEEPAGGWNYSFLSGLHLDRNGRETGRRIIDAYFEAPQTGQPDLTMACVDLSRIAAVEEAMSRFYYGIAADLSSASFSRISNLRFRATGFGRSAEDRKSSDGYDLVDLLSLTRCYQSLDEAGSEALREAAEAAVTCHRENLADSHGLSVYHPFRNRTGFTAGWSDLYPELCNAPGYAAYVDAYGRIMTGEQLVRWNHLDRLIWNPETQELTCALSPEQAENLASVRLVVLAYNPNDAADLSYYRVYESSEVRIQEEDGQVRLAADYRQEALQVLNREFLLPETGSISYRVSESGTFLVEFYPVEKDRPIPDTPLIGEYVQDPATGEMRLKSYLAYDEMTGSWSPRAQVDLSRYDGFVFVNEHRNPLSNEMGENLPFELWPEDVHTDTHEAKGYQIETTDFQLSFSADLVRSEWLEAGFEITDTQGNTFMTDLIFLDFNGFMPFTGVDSSFPDSLAKLGAAVTVSDDRVQVMLLTENRGEEPEEYALIRLSVNGISAPESDLFSNLVSTEDFSSVRISPGQKGMTVVSFDRALLEAVDPEGLIRTVSGTCMVMKGSEEESTLLSFTASPLVSAAAPEEDVYTELDLKIPAAGDAGLSWTQYATAYAGLGMGGETGARYVLYLQMTNQGDRSLGFGMQLNAMNGKHIEPIRSMGSGGSGHVVAEDYHYEGAFGNPSQLAGLAPGEKSAAALTLSEKTLAAIAPDVSLRECELMVSVYEVTEEGRLEVYDYFPLRMKMDINLAAVYPDARSLPSAEYMASLPENIESVELFSADGLTLYQERTFFAGNETLMLLRAENRSGERRSIVLGHARAGDEPAEIGCQYSDFVYLRNTQRKVYGLSENPWPEDLHAYISLEEGETRYWYVTVWSGIPETDIQKEGFSFDALILPEEGEMQVCQVAFTGPGAEQGYRGSVPVPIPEDQPLLETQPELSGAREMVWRTLRLKKEEAAPAIREAAYVVFQKYSSREKLIAENMLYGPELSPVKTWLIPALYGRMDVSPDGESCEAVCPEAQLAAYSGGEGFRIPGVAVERDEAGSFWLQAGMDTIHFMVFDKRMAQHLENLLLKWDPETDQVLLARQEGGKEMNADWAEMMYHLVYCVPEDSEGLELVRFMNDWLAGENLSERESFNQMQIIRDRRIRLVLEPMQTPEDCVVFIFWRDADGKGHYEAPVPLDSFPK